MAGNRPPDRPQLPPPLWLIITVGVVSFGAVAYLVYTLIG